MATAGASTSLPRFLLIDDDQLDRRAVRRALDQSGIACEITESDDAEAALALTAQVPFDCVLLDYLLPGTSAVELLPRILSHLPEAAVIVLTGHGDERIAVEMMKAGASDYLPKDRLESSHLANAIHHAMALQAARSNTARAERARQYYASKLRELVDAASLLYHGVVLEDRLRTAAQVARRIVDGEEAFVGLWLTDRVVCMITKDDEVTLYHEGDEICRRWLREAGFVSVKEPFVAQPAEVSSLIAHCRLELGTRGDGIVIVRGQAPVPDLADAMGALLAQIGHLVSTAIVNLALYQEVQASVTSRDAMLAVVSHDLRSPLSNIAMGLELMRGADVAQSNTLIERMERGTRHMKRLIDDLLDVARIETATFGVTPVAEPVQPILEESRDLLASLADASQIQLVMPQVPGLRVMAERLRLVQVLANLLGNAVKFTPPGQTIRVLVEAESDTVTFSVVDSGPGIEPAHLEHVFERYWRAGGRGLGLGLFIAKAIVDAHKGKIWAQSPAAAGRGASFSFSLPRAPDEVNKSKKKG